MNRDGGTIRQRIVVPKIAAFWLVAVIFGLFMFAASAPSPLYGLYATTWHFSALTLTAVFGVYALALLAALLIGGRLSDYLGRRPLIFGGLALEALAMASFLVANGVGLLFLARVVQGIATGLVTGALAAALIDLQPSGSSALAPIVNSSAPTFGLAIGALVTSVVVQYGPSPMRLIYEILLVACVVGLLGVLAMPESASRRPGVWGSLRPRASLPPEARGVFVAALPCLVALWALGGFYLALGPSLAAELVGSPNLVWGGLVILLLPGVGGMASVLLRGWKSERAMLAGSAVLLVGAALTLGAIATSAAGAFLVGTAIAGFGFGLAFLGIFRTLSYLATPDSRAGLIATIYIVSYLAFSAPVLVAGYVATLAGLRETAVAYAITLMALVALALFGLGVRRPSGNTPLKMGESHVDLPPSPCTVPHCLHPRHTFNEAP